MRYTTKKRITKSLLWLSLAVAIVIVNIWLIFVVQPITRLEKDLIKLDVSAYARVYPYDDGLMVVDQRELISYNLDGKEDFRIELPVFDMHASRNGNVTVVWDDTTAQIYNEEGLQILQKQMSDGGQILFGRAGHSYFVLATIEEGQYRARIYDYEAKHIDTMGFPYQSMLDLGFFGDSGDQLWALLLDSHGTIPITKVRTDHPGKSMTGSITILNQVCYDIMPLKSSVYVVGSRHIESYTYTSVEQSEVLVYGWTMQDYLEQDDEVSFLMGTNQLNEYASPVSALWYIGGGDQQFRLSMPTGIMKAAMSENYIYAFSSNGIYVYEIGRTNKNFQKLSFEIVGIPAVINGKGIVIQSEESFYLLPME